MPIVCFSMKLYNLFIATFFVLINVSVGPPALKKAELRDYLYTSNEANLKKLKTNKLDYLVKDLDQLYEVGYRMAKAYLDFFEENHELTDRLEIARLSAVKCVEKNMSGAINHHEDEVEALLQILEKTPKNPTCYKNLVTYINDMKQIVRERLAKDETFDRVKLSFSDTEEFLDIVEENTLKIPDEVKLIMERFVYEYVQMMIDHSENKAKKKKVREHSTSIIEFTNERGAAYVKKLRDSGILNKDVVIDVTKEYGTIEGACQDMTQKLHSATASIKNVTLTAINTIEKHASAKFFIIDNENNKKQLDCNDHVPYLRNKPTENVISSSVNDGKATLILTGTDEDGRNYKRNLTTDDANNNEMRVNEIIEYDDKVLDRKYVIVRAGTEET